MRKRWILRITGIVQGVGFRPFLYRIAVDRGLDGFVLNDDQGVLLEVEGTDRALRGLEQQIRDEAPPLARVDSIRVSRQPPAGHEGFEIRKSPSALLRRTRVSPDAATCPDCLREIGDPGDRRHRYPFTNCTHCGPRLTIIRDVPYDRARTTMEPFVMCADCRREYEDPRDRRFHAQPNACPACGPKVWLEDGTGIRLPAKDPIGECRRILAAGGIVAVKGLGGFHLACDARNEFAVHQLRARKLREEKPFALMARDLDQIERCCHLDEGERRLLESVERPIVLLRKTEDTDLPEAIAPRQEYLGFLLPYTPLHHLLLWGEPDEGDGPSVLVMTSGNLSDEPIAYQDADARQRLRAIADYFLLHDREIHLRCDDSVARLFRGTSQVLRRSRGYVPRAIPLHPPSDLPILAVGGMLKNTFALGRADQAYLSHHIGDLENFETLRSLEEGIVHFCRLLDHEPEVVAYDMHPDYPSTRLALDGPTPRKIPVQHHEAHVAAVLSEHAFEGTAIGVAFDGTGYGRDGTLWGGEFFVARAGTFERAGSLEPLPLPGGEAAIREPWRVALSIVHRAGKGADSEPLMAQVLRPVARQHVDLVERMLERGINCPWSTGAGRWFDGVASLLLGRVQNLYEGQAPAELEMLAMATQEDVPPYPVRLIDTPRGAAGRSGGPEWPTRFRVSLDEAVAPLLARRGRPGEESHLAKRFHRTMAEAIVLGAARLAEEEGARTVALGGGVFQNRLLLGMVVDSLDAQGLTALLPVDVPANDGGIAYGQLAVASWALRDGR